LHALTFKLNILLCFVAFYSDRTIKIYNVSDNAYEHTMTLEGHEGPVWQVSWAHPKFGVLLASCSFDGSVLIHREVRPRDWTLIYSNKSLHESSVNGLAFAPHELGLILAAASSDGNVSILSHQPDNSWYVEYIHDNALGVNAVSWAPTGAYSEGAHPRLVTGGCDNRIRFWIKNAETNQWEEDKTGPIGSELSHSDWVRDVAWAPPLMPDVNVVASCSEDRKVIIWTQSGGSGNDWKPTLLREFDAPVWRVSWSLTAQMLAVSSGDNHVTLWKAGIEGNWSQMGSIEDTASNCNQ
jgi:protein transport protein SEC13